MNKTHDDERIKVELQNIKNLIRSNQSYDAEITARNLVNKYPKSVDLQNLLGIALIVLLGVVWAFFRSDQSESSPLVFSFNSPSFSGIGQSSHYLTIENLEKSRKQALIDKAEAEERRLENELKNTAIQIFRRNLESMFYTALASQIIDNVFGEDGDKQTDGRTTIDGYKVIWTVSDTQDDENGTNVWIRDELTNEIIWKYTFPFQESE